jgi:hypothetical protein
MAEVSPLAKKIGLKQGMSALLVGAPGGMVALFEPLPAGAGVAVEPTGTPADVVLLFAADAAALDAGFSAARASAKDGALLWIAYPKGGKKAGTDLNRDILWEHMKPYGLTGVSLVAVDATWSAMRFRPTEEVGT